MGAPLALGVPALADPGGNGQGSGPESAPGQVETGVSTAASGKARGSVEARAGVKAGARSQARVKSRAGVKSQAGVESQASVKSQAGVNSQAGVKSQGAFHSSSGVKATGRARAAAAAAKSSPAGKTTLCHATGSATNPYVTITVSNHATPAHMRHQGGRDIVPAPAGGCPGGSAKNAGGGEQKAPKAGGQGKMTICHATGSVTNPFVQITIALPAVQAHARHQNGEDIIPAPATGCPGAPATTAGLLGQQPTVPGPLPRIVPGAAAPGVSPEGVSNVAPQAVTNVAPQAVSNVAPENQVLGVTNTSPARGNAAAPAAQQVAGAESSGAQLPFTGLDLWVVAVAGLALLLAGVAGRRALTHRG